MKAFNHFKRITICLLVLCLMFTQTAGATVIDETAPYFGDYLFVYNSTENSVLLTPNVSSSLLFTPQMSMSVADEISEEAQQIHWSPDFFDLDLPTNLQEAPKVKRLDAPILYAASVQPGDTLTYLVSNPLTGSYYNQNFIYQVSGSYCNILVEPDAEGNPKIALEDAQKLAAEFDTHIQPFMVENFGDYYTYLGLYLNTYLQYSKNTKMDILLYDIQDGYDGTTVRTYVSGYTDLTDFISESLGGNGNERGILHIDIYPLMGKSGTPNIENCYSTVVHEFQHQISYSDSLFDYFTGKTSSYINDAWWNEAFSMAAEHLYTGEPLTHRINLYNQATNSTPLRKGLVLDYQDYSENDNNVASNYGTCYLFGQYLRCQTKHLSGGGNQIYRTILEQTGTDYTTILAGLSSIGYEYVPESFYELYRNFRMATVLKNSTGPYGFAGESAFSGLLDNAYTGTSNITLKPGAAVVLKNPENYTPQYDIFTYAAFSDCGDFTYDLNAVSDTVVNVTHGELPEGGITLLAAGYDGELKLLGTDEVTVVEGVENYDYTLPQESVIRKFFLFSNDGNLKPLSYAEIR